MATILVIDDDRGTHELIRETFRGTEATIASAATASAGLKKIADVDPDVVLLDVMLPDDSGIDAIQNIKRNDPHLPVIFITASGDSDTAIEAMRLGAYDFLMKPLDLGRLREIVGQALETRRLMHVPVVLSESTDAKSQEDCLLGRSPQMLEVYKAIGRVAPLDVAVLIRGESGTGKELIARAIYHHSLRAQAPFLAVNCAAIPDALLESELFGHERGSFTGADRQRIGKFEQCSGGTILLDEVGDMSPLVQGKLVRLLQEQRFERVGGNQTIQTDVRIIAATHRDLEAMASEGTFRGDLYYRLNGFTISIPPLRDRGDDVVLMLERFFNLYGRQLGKEVQGISPDAVKLLIEYPWPGNVREMQSVIRRALLQTTGTVLMAEALPQEIRAGNRHSSGASAANAMFDRLIEDRLQAGTDGLYAEVLAATETCLLTRVLELTRGNQSQAARILGITRGSLRHKLLTLNIHCESAIVGAENAEDEVVAAAS